MNYFFKDLTFAVIPVETGKQWYDIKWVEKDGLLKCKPAEAKNEVLEAEGTDWDKIARGKTKCKLIEAGIRAGQIDISMHDSMQTLNKDKVNELKDFIFEG